MGLAGCAAPEGASTPTPVYAARVPPTASDEDIARHLARFETGDEPRLDEIRRRLDRLVPRPWTVERLAAYAAASLYPEEHADLVYLLAASKDPLGLRVAGLALDHRDLEVRVAAAEGIATYWIEISVAGGLEQVMDAAQAFWQGHRDGLLNVR